MKALSLVLALFLLPLTQQSWADDKPRLIRELLLVSGVKEAIFTTIEQSLRVAGVEAEKIPKIMDVAKKEMGADDYLEEMVPVYAQFFTLAEIKDMIDFYSSPTGKKLLVAMPQVQQAATKTQQVWVAQTLPRLQIALARAGLSLKPKAQQSTQTRDATPDRKPSSVPNQQK